MPNPSSTDETAADLHEALSKNPYDVRALNALAEMAAKDRKLGEALAYYDRVLALAPDDGNVWYNSAAVAAWAGDNFAAYKRGAKARTIEPKNRMYAIFLRQIASNVVPGWHFSMMNDPSRNFAYADAIKRSVRPGQTILEIGTGSGLLAMLAARNGPKRVITCEANPIMAEKAREIIAANGFSHLVTVISKISTDLVVGEDLPEKADVLITETFGAHLVGEGVLEALADAKARLLKPDAVIIPSSGAICGALVTSDFLASHVRTEKVFGLDLSAMNEFSPVYDNIEAPVDDLKWLSDEADLVAFDFSGSTVACHGTAQIEIEVIAPGRCLGVVAWIRIQTDAEVAYENPPQTDKAPLKSWPPAIFPFAAPIDVRPGQRVALEINYGPKSITIDLVSFSGASENPYLPRG